MLSDAVTSASSPFAPIASSSRRAWKPRSRSLDDLREVLHSITSSADDNSNDEEPMAEPKSLGLGLLQYPSAHGGSSVWRAALKQHEDDGDVEGGEKENDNSEAREAARAATANSRASRALAPLLFPVRVLPQHVPRATEIQSFLSRIECVEINAVVERDDDVVYYVLSVFRHRQQNGIPTRLRATTAPSSSSSSASTSTLAAQHKRAPVLTRSASSQPREPDYQLEHRFSSFARLRSNVLQVARKRHRRGHGCSYCSSLVTFFLESDAQPDLKAKFTTNTETRKQLLSQFINALLAVTRDNHVLCSRSMRGYHQVPMLMKRFLSEQTGENFFS